MKKLSEDQASFVRLLIYMVILTVSHTAFYYIFKAVGMPVDTSPYPAVISLLVSFFGIAPYLTIKIIDRYGI